MRTHPYHAVKSSATVRQNCMKFPKYMHVYNLMYSIGYYKYTNSIASHCSMVPVLVPGVPQVPLVVHSLQHLCQLFRYIDCIFIPDSNYHERAFGSLGCK